MMEGEFNRIYLVLLAFLPAFVGQAQEDLVNQGYLHVLPGAELHVKGNFENETTGVFYNDGASFLYQNLRNDGIFDYEQPDGLTGFVGNSLQHISGKKESFFYSLRFENSYKNTAFLLSSPILIDGLADFRRGILGFHPDGKGGISFSAGAEVENSSDVSHVVGKVSKFGGEDFLFPVGDGTALFPLEAAEWRRQDHYVDVEYRGEVVVENFPVSSRTGVLTGIDTRHSWYVENGTGEEYLLRLPWASGFYSENLDQAPQDAISIVRWDPYQQLWLDEAGSISGKSISAAVTESGLYALGLREVEKVLSCELVVYNVVTPNGDGMNDYFLIDQSNNTCARNIQVQIFNRWGAKVFETDNYGMNGQVFDGTSSGKMTLSNRGKLPSGTYFYLLEYEYSDEEQAFSRHRKTGFLDLTTD